MGTFEGFASADGKFFRLLAKNNDRAWFQSHKGEFEAGYNAPMKLLLADVARGIDRALPFAELDEPKVFRIFRDVRFSKDKSPYKTHIGGFIPIARRGKKGTEAPTPLYVQIGAKEAFAAAGHHMMDAEALAHFREAVADDKQGKALVKILEKLAKKGFSVMPHDALKRVPAGFDADHPRAELLKWKSLVVGFPKFPKGIAGTPKLAPWLVAHCKTAAPLVQWLVFATA